MQVPGALPVMIPVDDPIVATVALLVDQIPPVTELPRVVEPPAQTENVPVMVPGAGVTVAIVVT